MLGLIYSLLRSQREPKSDLGRYFAHLRDKYRKVCRGCYEDTMFNHPADKDDPVQGCMSLTSIEYDRQAKAYRCPRFCADPKEWKRREDATRKDLGVKWWIRAGVDPLLLRRLLLCTPQTAYGQAQRAEQQGGQQEVARKALNMTGVAGHAL